MHLKINNNYIYIFNIKLLLNINIFSEILRYKINVNSRTTQQIKTFKIPNSRYTSKYSDIDENAFKNYNEFGRFHI